MADNKTAVNSAHFDANQVPTIMGVIGSAGTSDTGGTAYPLPVGVREDTGAMYVYNLGPAGAVTVAGTDPTSFLPARLTDGTTFYTASGGTGGGGGTVVNIATGTINSATVVGGTLTNLVSGTINALAAGTITTGTVSVTTGTVTGKEVSGAAKVAAGVLIAGTDAGGTIYHPLVTSGGALTVTGASTGTNVNIVTGSQQTLGTVGVVNSGTLNALAAGTITTGTVAVTIGTIVGPTASGGTPTTAPVLMAGTDATGTVYAPLITNAGLIKTIQTAGTLSVGTLTNLVSGTINALATGTITGGTLTNLVSGTINALASGTVTAGTLTNLATGTLNALATGTITGGTLGNLNYGTINVDPHPTPVKTLLTNYGTVGTTGAAVFGTLVPSVGNGTFAYIAGCSITGISGTTEASIVMGTFTQTAPAGGTNMLARVNAVPGGGIAKAFNPNFVSGTGGTICYWMAGAGTVYFDVFYYAGV